jgi:hypothetical protein
MFADLLFKKVFYHLINNLLRSGRDAMNLIRFSCRHTKQELVRKYEYNGIGTLYKNKQRTSDRGFRP